MFLIVEVHLKYSGDAWQGYDQHFRQRVVLTTKIQWTTIDPTLWNLTFAGNANAKRCKHCSSLYHSHDSYNWAPEPATSSFRYWLTPQPLLTSTCRYRICLTCICLHPLMAHSPAANMNISAVSVQKSTATNILHKTTYCAHWNNPDCNQNYYTVRQPLHLQKANSS